MNREESFPRVLTLIPRSSQIQVIVSFPLNQLSMSQFPYTFDFLLRSRQYFLSMEDDYAHVKENYIRNGDNS